MATMKATWIAFDCIRRPKHHSTMKGMESSGIAKATPNSIWEKVELIFGQTAVAKQTKRQAIATIESSDNRPDFLAIPTALAFYRSAASG